MNILFIGRFYPAGIVEHIKYDTFGKVGFSNHNFEISLIEGFRQQPDIDLRVISAPMVFSYPHNNRKKRIHEIKYAIDNISVRSIGFCNIVGLNIFSIKRSLSKAILQEINVFQGDEVVVIVNTPSLELSTALFRAKKKTNKKIRTTLIVPDIPDCLVEMAPNRSIKTRLVEQLNKRTHDLAKRYDKYVYLTEAMNDFYHVSKDKYIVMEGLIDENNEGIKYQPVKYGQEKEIILYTGTLSRIFGVIQLLDIFEKLNIENSELWICGSGEARQEITERAKKNPKIKFWGLVDSAQSREMQQQATILANPRSAEGRYTKYSFPSKTIEYLLAGRPVIMNRLQGIPSEYDQYLYYPTDESIDGWVEKLNEIVNTDPLIREYRAVAARNFILAKKTARYQCSRIIDLCKN